MLIKVSTISKESRTQEDITNQSQHLGLKIVACLLPSRENFYYKHHIWKFKIVIFKSIENLYYEKHTKLDE